TQFAIGFSQFLHRRRRQIWVGELCSVEFHVGDVFSYRWHLRNLKLHTMRDIYR
uniref:FACT complex subunit SSRP1 n=1 Tax=Parascaris univalens TaxID=6257 RepID=A0A914ZVD8_PARUN